MGQNSDFYVTPTSGVCELLFAARGNFNAVPEFKAQDSNLMSKAFRGFCKEGVRGYFEAISDKPYILDKARSWIGYIDFLHFWHDKPKVICMVRDPRAIFSSMEKNFRKSQALSSPIKIDGNLEGTTTQKRVEIWSCGLPVGLALERLYQLILEKKTTGICFIKYEDLTRDPKIIMSQIYDYLGVDDFEHDFARITQVTQEDDSVYGTFGDHIIRPVVSQNPDDYSDILGAELSSAIKTQYEWFYDYFNYK